MTRELENLPHTTRPVCAGLRLGPAHRQIATQSAFSPCGDQTTLDPVDCGERAGMRHKAQPSVNASPGRHRARLIFSASTRAASSLQRNNTTQTGPRFPVSDRRIVTRPRSRVTADDLNAAESIYRFASRIAANASSSRSFGASRTSHSAVPTMFGISAPRKKAIWSLLPFTTARTRENWIGGVMRTPGRAA